MHELRFLWVEVNPSFTSLIRVAFPKIGSLPRKFIPLKGETFDVKVLRPEIVDRLLCGSYNALSEPASACIRTLIRFCCSRESIRCVDESFCATPNGPFPSPTKAAATALWEGPPPATSNGKNPKF